MKKTLLLATLLGLSQISLAKGIEASDAWARSTVKGMTQGGGFVVLNNTDSRDNALIGARVSRKIADKMELHTHEVDSATQMMKMRAVKQIPLPAQSVTKLEPSSYHVMFLGLKKELKVGQKIPVVLKFQDGRQKRVVFTVKLSHSNKQHSHHEHHHNHPSHQPNQQNGHSGHDGHHHHH